MRAVCESCEAPQPVDWTPGDLCIQCGHVARRERRCHWCAGWTPEGRFCRTCGAETLADAHYPAGRMLKHAGVDQFSIPERLRSFDVEQIENLTRIYQRQAVVVARLIADQAFTEQFLYQKVWSDELDDSLAPRLPMPDGEIDALRLPPSKATDANDRLEEIVTTAPLPQIRTLAALARLRRSPSPIGTEHGATIAAAASAAVSDGDERIRHEGALTLSGWRVLYGPERFFRGRDLAGELEAIVARGRFPVEAAVGLRLLGYDVALDASARPTTDGDAAFAFAMALGETDAITAALRNPERHLAAAQRLAEIGQGAPLHETIITMSEAELVAVLEAFPRDSVQPTLHDPLLRLAEATANERIRTLAVTMLVAEGRPADASRLVQLAPSERWIVQAVIQRMPLDTAELTALCTTLAADGRFDMHQYGVSELAETGKLRDDFVPSVWALVGTDELRLELLRFAEEQLKKRGDDGLHTFVLGVMFGAWSATVRAEAWWGLRRWYTSIEYASEGPLVMDTGAIERFFPSVAEFFERFGVLLGDRETLAELTLQEKLASMLRYAPADALPALLRVEPAWTRLRAILVRTLRDVEIRLDMRSSIVRFFELVAGIDVARRTTVLADLAGVTEDAVPDLAYEAQSTAARIVERFAEPVRETRSCAD